jgi:hypothetical protein
MYTYGRSEPVSILPASYITIPVLTISLHTLNSNFFLYTVQKSALPPPSHLALRYLQYPVFFIELSKGLYMSENVPLLPLGKEVFLGGGR